MEEKTVTTEYGENTTLQKELEKGLIITVFEQFMMASVVIMTFGVITMLPAFYLGFPPVATIMSFGIALCTLTFGLIITLIRWYQFNRTYDK